MLPKPDKTIRALYTGIIDPRVISNYAIGLTPYFDEIIIQHPFINPCSVNPEYSPINHPHKFKQQTLKNVLLLVTLMPFIEAGFINFIPDPCSFDLYLHREMLNMAEERSKNYKLSEKEKELLEKLNRDDFERTVYMLSKNQQRFKLSEFMPDLSPEEIEKTFQYLENERLKDPYALLQDDLFEKGGQFSVFQMLPNFEMSLFIAQITYSLLLTDSDYRWNEIINSEYKQSNPICYWEDLIKFINNLDFRINPNPKQSFELRTDSNFGEIRKVFRCIYSATQNNQDISNVFFNQLKKEFISSFETSQKRANQEKDFFLGKFKCAIPQGGFVHNNVQRLLLKSGSKNYLNSVSMAIFVEQA